MAEGLGGRDDHGRGPARHSRRVGSRCTAIVPAWNAETTLARTLASLVHDNGDSVERVVVVVSGGDCSAAIACGFDRVDVVVLTERATAGRARNVGRARASGAELLLFVD